MESTNKYTHPLLTESTSKDEPLLGRLYEWFLEGPVPIVLAVMWLAGVGLLSVCGLALYYLWLSLRAVAGG
jgi:hypothetical protein